MAFEAYRRMRRLSGLLAELGAVSQIWLAVTFAALPCCTVGRALARDPATIDHNLVWRAPQFCGVNCLYALLKSCGSNPEYDTLRSMLGDGARPTSLSDLHDVAAKHRVATRLGRAGPEGLRRLPLPFIAHLENVTGSGSAVGHYCVVYGVNENNVYYMDGTTANLKAQRLPRFCRDWSGYVCYVEPAGQMGQYAPSILLFLGLGGGLAGADLLRTCLRRWRITGDRKCTLKTE